MVKSFGKYLASITWLILANITPLTAQEYVGGMLMENTVFSPGLNPYIVIEPIIVPEGITLTIEPGTQVFFMVSTSLRIEGGTLIASGLPDQQIVFNAQTERKWDGIKFFISRAQFDEQGNYLNGNILKYVSIQQTTTAIVLSDTARILADNVYVTTGDYGVTLQSGAEIMLTNSIIDQCSYGLYIKNSNYNTISSCQVSNCDIGIFFPSNNESSHNLISNNNLSYNRNIALFMSIGQSMIQFNRITGNTVAYNNIGLHIGNGGIGDRGYNCILFNVVQHNDIGIKLSQDADTLRANLVEMNGTGIILAKAGNNEINNNIIQNCSGFGLLITDGSNLNKVSGNGIYNNDGGIRVTHKDFQYSINNLFSYNSLGNNRNEAFLFESGPQKPIEFNSIVGIRDTAVFVNHFYLDLEAPHNWFGSLDTTLIDSLIYDLHDNDLYGEVIYKPFLTNPDPQAPISKPAMVIKRLVGDRIWVEWNNNSESDLAGYKVYYGHGTSGYFSDVIDVGADTLVIISGITLNDSVAVTAYDNDANGISDQFEGHESAFSYAIAGPYAGNDTTVCQGESFIASYATALESQNLTWLSSGDGTFTDPSILITTYLPGENDLLSGSVKLTLQQLTGQYLLTDDLLVEISGIPFAYAGKDTIVNQHEDFLTNYAEAENYESMQWITTGDGLFLDAQALLTTYLPGDSDILEGFVDLILKLTSSCGDLSDTLRLQIIPSYAVNGRVLKESIPADDGFVIAINALPDGARAISTAYTNAEGVFEFNNLPVGDYLLYAITNPLSGHQWIPTYYAESTIWQSAYPLPLNTDVYDVDINLNQINNELPAGNCFISGSFNYQGKTAEDDSIYNMYWFTDRAPVFETFSGIPAANHTVLLMNTELNRVFAWKLTASDGSFYFAQLPYGSYRLWGEKAGYTNSLSPVITLSPLNNQIEGVQLNVTQKNIEVTLPPMNAIENAAILYPNPASDWLWFNDIAIGEFQTMQIRFVDATGRLVKETSVDRFAGGQGSGIDISDVKPGFYICFISGDNGFNYSTKISIAR